LNIIYLLLLLSLYIIFFAGPNLAHMAGLDSASPAWSLAHASDHLQKKFRLLRLETGSLG
jgi:hypothetical protein